MELRSAGVIVQIAPSEGGRIVSLIVGGEERILSKARARPSALATGWGCYPMVPWAGRLFEGRIPIDGAEGAVLAQTPSKRSLRSSSRPRLTSSTRTRSRSATF